MVYLSYACLLAVGATPGVGVPILPLANEYVTVYESPDPLRIFCYTPGLTRLDNGRIIVTCDLGGPGVIDLDGVKLTKGDGGNASQGKVFTSDSHGQTWTHKVDFPFYHARPFMAGKSLYVLGHAGDLAIMRSDDGGDSWTTPVLLTTGQTWHQSACNVHYANGCVYLVMERRMTQDLKTWAVGELAPILMRARIGDDLTKAESWTMASPLPFRSLLANAEGISDLDYFGVPFYDAPYPSGTLIAPKRNCAPLGWLETNVVQFNDPNHIWYDPRGKTFHLWMRAHTGGTGYAAIAKVIEKDDGSMETILETVPSGKRILYTPCPGGQMRFHILHDEKTSLFWLLSTQSTDSMTRADALPPERFNLPNNERQRLQLHFSRNCVDWCFAGLVATGETQKQARHYASMAVDGDDLVVLSRSGDAKAHGAHDGNMITFHRIHDFRALVY